MVLCWTLSNASASLLTGQTRTVLSTSHVTSCSSQHVLVHEATPPHAQNFALLVELHEASVSPFLYLVKVLLDGITALCSISHSSQLGVVSKLSDLVALITLLQDQPFNQFSIHLPAHLPTLHQPHCEDLMGEGTDSLKEDKIYSKITQQSHRIKGIRLP